MLLVEDEEKVARFVTRGLKAERYAVDVAADGNSGLDHVRAYTYDLIILDLNLPGMPGTDLLKYIRKDHPHVPVLILTARDNINDKVKNFEAGADDYLTKPFSFAELLVRVKALLRRGPVTNSTTLRVGELELDRVAHKVKRGEKPIELTSKEFSLLEYLMINAGRVSREPATFA
jgi:two-component system copper resistance phosphate regulon response regulator CusR